MISAEDCEFISKFEVAKSEDKQEILTKEGHQVDIRFFLDLFNTTQPVLFFKNTLSMVFISKYTFIIYTFVQIKAHIVY